MRLIFIWVNRGGLLVIYSSNNYRVNIQIYYDYYYFNFESISFPYFCWQMYGKDLHLSFAWPALGPAL